MSTRERYPTAEAPAAFQKARELHMQLLEHLKDPLNPAKLKAEAERVVDEAMAQEGLVPPKALPQAKPDPTAEGADAKEDLAQQDAGEGQAQPSREGPPAPAGSEAASPTPAPGSPTASEAGPAQSAAPGPDAKGEEALEKAAPLPSHLATQVAQLEAVAGRQRAVAQRAQLDEMASNQAVARKGGAVALALLGGLMAHFGLAHIFAKLITDHTLGQLVANLVITALLAVVLAGLALHVAQKLGLSKLARRAPERISSLQALRGIYRTELYGEGPLNEAQSQELEQQLQAAHHTMLDNQDPEDHVANAKTMGVVGLVVLAFLGVAIPAAQQGLHGTWWQHLLVAAFGMALVGGLVVALASKLQPLPPLGEGLLDPTEARQRAEGIKSEHEASEAKRLAALRLATEEATKRAKREAESQEAARQAVQSKATQIRANTQAKEDQAREASYQAERQRRIAQHLANNTLEQQVNQNKTRDRLYQELQDASESYEQARGFTTQELRHLRGLQWSYKWFFALLLLLTVLSSIVATYPASLTVSELLNLPYQYVAGQRLAFGPWLLFIALALFADYWLVQAYTERSLAQVELAVLEEGYQESRLRPQGIRYHLKLHGQVAAVLRRTRKTIAVGVVLLLVEFAANVTYLVQNSEANLILATAMALVPFAVFVAMTYPHVILLRKSTLVRNALAWGGNLQQGPSLPPIQAPPFAEAESQQARAQAAERGLL